MEKQDVLDSRLIEKFELHKDFTRLFLDAFVLINREHKILKFNSAFCQIAELRAVDVRKIGNFDSMITTHMPGVSQTAIDQLLTSHAPTRIDEVPAVNVTKQKELTLIISSYLYYDTDGAMLGACLLLRDVTAETNLQSKYKNKSLESITDPLTGLFTRRYFEAQIEKEIARCKNNDLKLSMAILMFDLDNFKNVNDTYGHQAGDYVLEETANILKKTSRRSDILGRYGGEELLVLIFETTPKLATLVAEKFRSTIHEHEYIFDGKKILVTTSIGVTLLSSYEDTKEAAIKRADACLYLAKEAGRNVVVIDFGNGKIPAQEYLKTNPG
ncbi:MAG: diguanylate cyclase [Bdellovibrionota bacterium]